jgi:hypothetical protein
VLKIATADVGLIAESGFHDAISSFQPGGRHSAACRSPGDVVYDSLGTVL